MAFCPDGRTISVPMPGGDIDVVDVVTLKPTRTLRGHANEVLSLEYSHDGNRLASTGVDGTTKVWDPMTGHELLSFSGGSWTWDVAFSRDNRRLVAANGDGSFSIWGQVTEEDDLESEEAQSIVRFLFAKPMVRSQAIVRLQAEHTISSAARERALEIAAVYPEDVRKLYREAWAVVRDPRAGAASACVPSSRPRPRAVAGPTADTSRFAGRWPATAREILPGLSKRLRTWKP